MVYSGWFDVNTCHTVYHSGHNSKKNHLCVQTPFCLLKCFWCSVCWIWGCRIREPGYFLSTDAWLLISGDSADAWQAWRLHFMVGRRDACCSNKARGCYPTLLCHVRVILASLPSWSNGWVNSLGMWWSQISASGCISTASSDGSCGSSGLCVSARACVRAYVCLCVCVCVLGWGHCLLLGQMISRTLVLSRGMSYMSQLTRDRSTRTVWFARPETS